MWRDPKGDCQSSVTSRKARGGRLEHCSGEDAGSTRTWRGRVLSGESLKEWQNTRNHFSRWAWRKTGDLPTTWDKRALPNSSTGTSVWEERSAPVGQLSEWHFHSRAIYSHSRKLLIKCWSAWQTFWFCSRYGIFQMWWAQR